MGEEDEIGAGGFDGAAAEDEGAELEAAVHVGKDAEAVFEIVEI